MAPVFFLLAGPNGAGKSTLYHAAVAEGLIPAEIEFVNADLYEARHLQDITSPAQRSERVLARYPRTLTHLRDAVRRVDLALLYDTSDSSEHDGIQPPRLVARWRKGQDPWMASKPPAWTMRLLA